MPDQNLSLMFNANIVPLRTKVLSKFVQHTLRSSKHLFRSNKELICPKMSSLLEKKTYPSDQRTKSKNQICPTGFYPAIYLFVGDKIPF